jgi:stress-induced morphogen
MAMDIHTLEKMIRDGIPGAQVRIDDLRGDGDHYAAHVSSPAFKGLSRIAQHQLVYAALKGTMGRELHALSLHTTADPLPAIQGATL